VNTSALRFITTVGQMTEMSQQKPA